MEIHNIMCNNTCECGGNCIKRDVSEFIKYNVEEQDRDIALQKMCSFLNVKSNHIIITDLMDNLQTASKFENLKFNCLFVFYMLVKLICIDELSPADIEGFSAEYINKLFLNNKNYI